MSAPLPPNVQRTRTPGIPSREQISTWARELQDSYVKVGIPYNADQPKKYYADEERTDLQEDPDLTLVEVATFNEFGTRDGRVPPRPFMAIAAESGRQTLKVLVAKSWVSVLRGKREPGEILELVGMKHASQIQGVIQAGVEPGNAPFTIERKGSSRTLIDQGQLVQSITYQAVTNDPGRSEVKS